MRWSEAVTLKFVKLYLKHECLWNPAHPNYKTRFHREKAYHDIIHEFKNGTTKSLTIIETKMKIKNLRTTYTQQVQKILQRSNPDSIYQPSLVWFHEMDRCLKHIPTNRHNLYNNDDSHETPVVDSSSNIWVNQDIMQSSAIEETNPDPLVPQLEDEYVSLKPEEAISDLKRQKHPPPVFHKKKRKKKIKRKSVVKDYSTDSNSESSPKEDEFDIYGKFIASHLRKMDLHKAIRLQLEIQNLVSKARISDLLSD